MAQNDTPKTGMVLLGIPLIPKVLCGGIPGMCVFVFGVFLVLVCLCVCVGDGFVFVAVVLYPTKLGARNIRVHQNCFRLCRIVVLPGGFWGDA